MAISQPQQPSSVYDRLREHLDARDLLARLGIAIARELGSEAYCRPLCHESTSGQSLQINLHTGRWNCKACQSSGVYGDLIQLVEYVRSDGRAPAHGANQSESPTHRDAVRWLCEQFAVPYESERRFVDPSLDVVHMFAMLAHRHLLANEQVLAWVRERWGFDRSTVESYGIGYMPAPILTELAAEAARAESRDAFRSSGIGFYPPSGVFTTRFAGRVTFPYLENGRAVYLIGRATPWTPKPEDDGHLAKYHKLLVHSDKRPHISQRITNDHLYNESVMRGAKRVVIAEGVADAVALSSIGVQVVSPVTISFNAVDLERFVRKAKENAIARVEILFDNELSGSGNYGAIRVGRKLVEAGLCVSILTLPLGQVQRAARDEVLRALGEGPFEELEKSEPHKRKELIANACADDVKRAWIVEQINASKIDAAEWCAAEGAGAAERFELIRKEGRDVVGIEIEAAALKCDPELDIHARIAVFSEAIALAAHVDERMSREEYAGQIAQRAGKGISKAAVQQRIAASRRALVDSKRATEDAAPSPQAELPKLVLLPPDVLTAQPAAPPPPQNSTAPAAPPPPASKVVSEHERYGPVRESVMRSVEAKLSEEMIGQHVAQTVTFSMGYTPFRTPDELYLVRGNERIPVGLTRPTPRFASLLYMASGLTFQKTSHRAYISSTSYFLEREAKEAHDVSWSHVGEDGAVFFPTGDVEGHIVRIDPGAIHRTRMSEARVPAVAGQDFRPFRYTEKNGGIADAIETFRWTSLSHGDRLVLVYWIVCLPILRRVGSIPIVRIEGGSSSGKTRSVDAVSYLVNGGKSSSVPTAAALISRMSTEMLTIDDNRESTDMTPAFRGTLLQATNLGAREKRKVSSDTGTVVERVCGALLMNGIEPIHDGKSELASRMLTLRCDKVYRMQDSPVLEKTLIRALLDLRDRFWSEATRRCADALQLDATHGEVLGTSIEEIFGATRIGRLSAYLRLMYLAWVAGLEGDRRASALVVVDHEWRAALSSLGEHALESLVREELSVSAVRYAFAYGEAIATVVEVLGEKHAFDGKFRMSLSKQDAVLGPMTAAQLARVIRSAGKELNAPRPVSVDLRAGQLEARIMDGQSFFAEAGLSLEVMTTNGGKRRFTFYRPGPEGEPLPDAPRQELDAKEPPAGVGSTSLFED